MMRKFLTNIVLISFILFSLIGLASASEDVAGVQLGNCPASDFDDVAGVQLDKCIASDSGDVSSVQYDNVLLGDGSDINEDDSSISLYINSSKETDGDGSNWENALNDSKTWHDLKDKEGNAIDNCTIYFADGEYVQEASLTYKNASFIGQGNNTVISLIGDNSNRNSYYRFVNLTFVKKVDADGNASNLKLGANYEFVNCNFIDLPIVTATYYTGSTITNVFENCFFSNANQVNLFTNTYREDLRIFNCSFENIECDAIVYNEECGCTIIQDSAFRDCNIKGILKCNYDLTGSKVSNCVYDDKFCLNSPINTPFYFNSTDDLKVYVNNSREAGGDGSSWDNAINSLIYYEGLTLYLSEGNYSISNGKGNYRIVGLNDRTVIRKFWEESNVTAVNLTFDIIDKTYIQTAYILNATNIYYDIKATGRFINCSFINESFVLNRWEHVNPQRDILPEVQSISFEGCKFLGYEYNKTINNHSTQTSWGETAYYEDYESPLMFDAYEFSKWQFNNCLFENINGECIIDSWGGNFGYNGEFDGVYISNSQFKSCDVEGIVKARNLAYVSISNCSYDFPVSYYVPVGSEFYLNTTDHELLKTELSTRVEDNNLIISLRDSKGNPLVDFEVEIISNGKVLGYYYTDSNGQFVLKDLNGSYNFEINYYGDPYEGYVAVSLNKTLTFSKVNKFNTVLSAPKITAVYGISKKLTITLKDKNNKVLASKKVSIKLGSITKTLTTNAKGQVSIDVSALLPKAYTATVKFAGDNAYYASSLSSKVIVSKASVKITAKAKSFKLKAKTKKYTVSLKNNKGKVMKGIKLTLKIGKKTYTAKTNKKGVATFKLKLTKKGKNNAVLKFAGNKYFKALSKKVKIVVK